MFRCCKQAWLTGILQAMLQEIVLHCGHITAEGGTCSLSIVSTSQEEQWLAQLVMVKLASPAPCDARTKRVLLGGSLVITQSFVFLVSSTCVCAHGQQAGEWQAIYSPTDSNTFRLRLLTLARHRVSVLILQLELVIEGETCMYDETVPTTCHRELLQVTPPSCVASSRHEYGQSRLNCDMTCSIRSKP